MQILNAENFSLKSLLSAKGISALALATTSVVGVTGAAVSHNIATSDNIISGVQFEGKSIAGLNEAGAKKFFESEAAKKMKPLTFNYEGQEFQIQPSEINWTAQVDKAVADAEKFGRGGGIIKDLGEQINTAMSGRSVNLAAVYDEDLLNQKLNDIAAQVNRQPVNAYVNFHGDGTIEPIAGVIGKKLDTTKIAEALKDPLNNLTASNSAINLEPEDILPYVTTDDVINIDTVLGSYSTSYSPGSRGDNIALAASALFDKMIKPGWEFSFNDTVGHRTYAAGYQNAGVIVNGRADVGVGGGVCQVSSTLYNAVLLAGLTPTERSPHYFKSSYIAAGRDATVADDLLDLKFRNDLRHPVFLKTYASGSTLTVYVLGTRADLDGASISIESAGSSYGTSIYRVYRKDGAVIKDEFLHTDSYHTNSNS